MDRKTCALSCALCIIVVAICVIIYLTSKNFAPFQHTLAAHERKIIVVGNAEYFDLGHIIDSYDIVVRINPMDPQLEKHTGKKVDILHINENINLGKVKPHLKIFLASVRVYWTRIFTAMKKQLDTHHVKYDNIVQYDLRLFKKKYSEEYASCPKNMTSGLLAIMHALCTYPCVHTAGISAYTRPSFQIRSSKRKISCKKSDNLSLHRRRKTTFDTFNR